VAARHVFLVRHGESTFNAEARIQGQADAPLSDAGRAQARTLVPVLDDLPAPRAISSDLARAAETAALAGRPDAAADERWRERAMGVWTEALEADLPAADLAAFRAGRLVPPGAETWDDVQRRVGEALEELARGPADAVVFTHGGCVRAAVTHLTGADPATIAGPANVSVTTLQLAPRRRVLVFNWSARPGIPRASDPGTHDLAAGRAAPSHADP
jgi:glucosyl-3-phosphoglycerate phosphatase